MSIQELEERVPLTAADLEALRAKHGRVTHVRYNGVDLVFRKPTRDEAQMYRSSPQDTQDERHEAMATLVQFIIVQPSVEDLNALLDEYPFMLSNEGINDAVTRAMGVREEKKSGTEPAKPKKPTRSASPEASPSGSPSAREAS